jgi:hypothetical protein
MVQTLHINSLTRSLLTKFGAQRPAMETCVSAVCITSNVYFRHRLYKKQTGGCFYISLANLSKRQLRVITNNF